MNLDYHQICYVFGKVSLEKHILNIMIGGYGDVFMAIVAKYIQLHTCIATQLFNFQQSILCKLVKRMPIA